MREVQDSENTVWSCVEAYAGLKSESDDSINEAARVKGASDKIHVVATPSGGAQTVRLELPTAWETDWSDEQLLDEIKKAQQN